MRQPVLGRTSTRWRIALIGGIADEPGLQMQPPYRAFQFISKIQDLNGATGIPATPYVYKPDAANDDFREPMSART